VSAPLEIINYPDPVLRRKAEPVQTIDEELGALAEAMIETMHENTGIGLAANQVGRLLRLFVLDLGAVEEGMGAIVCINPEIIEEEGQKISEEGCLSFPELRGEVPRPARIRARFTDLEGTRQEVEVTDLLARAFCHETDHLDGVLFIDRMSATQRQLLAGRLRELARGIAAPRA
jgi:peptide deformylase